MILLFLLFMASTATLSHSLDTLKQGQSLNSSQVLVSSNGHFTLGFFSLAIFPENIYFAIWFSNGTNETTPDHPVWIGNRNKPFHKDSAVLSLDNTSKLIIGNNGTDALELFGGGSQTDSNTTAILLDSGNFVLRETNSNGSAGAVLWESFNYPTDTLLPGMKLGINHRTGRNWTLTSWLTDNIPADGAFILEWDPSGHRLAIKQRGVIYWVSGSSNDQPFEYIFLDSDIHNYHFINVSNEDEEYFSYRLTPTAFSMKSRNYISGWIMDYRGELVDQQ